MTRVDPKAMVLLCALLLRGFVIAVAECTMITCLCQHELMLSISSGTVGHSPSTPLLSPQLVLNHLRRGLGIPALSFAWAKEVINLGSWLWTSEVFIST